MRRYRQRSARGLGPSNEMLPHRRLSRGLFVAETVKLTGISFFSVKRYRKHLLATLRSQ